MRKNTRKIIALLMAITMIIALFPMNVFAQTDIVQAQTDSSVIQSADNKETETALDEDGSAQTAQPEAEATQTEADAITATDTADEVINYSASAVNSLENPFDFLAKGAKTTSKSKPRSASVVSASVDLLSGEGTAQEPYLIQSSSDWDALSDYINNGGTEYNGKYFKLTDNITVTKGLGYRPGSTDNQDRPFCGTFDGDGHTLNLNISTDAGFASPFAIVHNTTIKNLKVTGTVQSSNNHATGLVGASKAGNKVDDSYLNIQNVIVSANVSCNSHIGGIVGHAHKANITMENVIFNGSISASSVQGGFIGWGGANAPFSASFKDCMFTGTYKSGGAFHPIAFASGQGTVTLTNDFYTTKAPSGGSPITPTGSGAVKLVVATVEKDGQVNYFDNITTAVNSSNWTTGSTLKLLSDVNTSGTITVPSGEHTLDLNGHTVKAASAGYSVITVGSGAELVIDDTAGGGKITGGSVGQNYGGGVTVDAGKLTLRGGAISANANTYGSIGYCGGGVLVKNSAKFYMEGGEISANTSYVGGGVCCDTSNTTVIITGGEIKNNKITRFGSGVLAGRSNGATFRIGGDAKIIDNISTWTSDKDGEASVNFSKLSISGNPTVRGCWKTSDNSAPNTHINLDNAGSSVQLIDIDGALTNESGTPNILLSPIYRWNDLKNGKTFVFTSGWSTYMGTANPADYFGLDKNVSGVRIIRKDGEAAFTGSNDLGDLYITYNANGGTGEMDAQLVSSSSAVLNQNHFTNGNKDFIGWNTKADGTGTPYNDKGNITLTGDVTLYAQWADKHEHDDLSFRRWTSTTSLPTVAGNYYLGADVTLSGTWNVPTGTTKLCLNGHGIKMTGSGSVITVSNSADFSIYDCGKTEHKFTVNSPASNGAGCAIVNDSLTGDYKTFTGGYITGGNARNGGGIKVNGTANLTLNGGTIIGNQSSFMGAGIKADNNGDNTNINITVNGGAVIYNTVNGYGAGLCSDGSITMTGGTVAYNYATKDPGGIHCHHLYLSGGSIVNNYADDNEYSAGVHADHEVFISGNPVISNNVYKGTPYNLDWDRTELAHGHKLNITGALTEGAKIYVTLKVGGTGVFTSGWETNMGEADPAKYFTSDNADYSVFLNQNGEAEIGVPPVASIISGETVTNYSSLAEAVNAWLAGSTLKLMSDVTTANTITVPSGEHTLDLNGHELKRTGATGSDNSGLVITVGDGVNLTVMGPGKITGGNGFHGGGIHVEGNSSLVLDNCEISGNTGHYGGGLYLKNGTITLKNGTAVKNNSATEGFGGSGIYAEGSGTLILEGGTFTNNEIRNNNQYAVFLAGNANAQISGAPVIYDNKYGSTQKNLYMFQAGNQHSIVRIAGALTDGAKIGVGQTTVTGEITSGWKDKMGNADPAEYFTSDNSEYSIFLNSDGEAEIGVPPIPDVSSEGFEGDYDAQPHSISVSAPESTTIKYGTEEGSYVLDKNPSYTDAGTYTVYYEVSQAKHTSVTGSQTVVINQINATVTVVGHNTTVDYDGEVHSIENYDVEIANPLYSESDFTFNGRAEAVRTNAGTTNMGLSAEQFVNTNSNFATVTFEITDGYLTVNPINASVTITGHNAIVDYNGKAQSADGYDVQIDNPLYKESDFKFNGRAEAVRTNAGTTNMGLSAEQFENISENFATVTFDVTDGYITVNKVDAVIKGAPHAKSTLDYNGKSQTLCVAGVVNGGTLYYALGKDDKTVPANSKFKTSLPVATEIGNYYIWYKVKADKNHNDISADCFKVTLANKEWVTISGKIFSNDKKPLEGAEVILMSGNSIVDTISSYENGEYYFTVPKGVYNIVVKYKGLTVTNIASIDSDKVSNIVMSETNTDSVLDVQSSDKSIAVGGLDKEAEYIRNQENIPDDVNVTVKMTVKAVAQNDTNGAKLITDFAKDKYIEFYNLDLQKIIGSESTRMDKTQNVLEIVIPCSFVNKRELAVYSCDGSSVSTFTLSDSKQAGTFRVDVENGLVYIYADSFNTLAIAYQPYFSVLSDISLGAYEGNVSVKLTKDNDSSVVYELSDVSLQNISFTGVPRGTYTMTVSWIDGVENTLTLPFNIK